MLQMCLNVGEGTKEGTRESRGREMHMSPGLECVRLQMCALESQSWWEFKARNYLLG